MVALRFSIINGFENLAKFLIKSGARDMPENDGKYAIHVAAASGTEISPELLLDLTTEYDITDKCGKTALHLVAENGYVPFLRHLLEADRIVNASARPKSVFASYTPSQFTRSQILGKDETITHSRINSLGSFMFGGRKSTREGRLAPFACTRDNDGRNALELAIIGGHIAATNLLLKKMFDYEIPDAEKQSLAHLAANYGHAQILRLLAKHNINLNLHGSNSLTPFQVASHGGDPDGMIETMGTQNPLGSVKYSMETTSTFE
ncbi:hypothetical protein QQS21_002949 [Conoideocrella luteorostrata]|uniref:Uncharacterized protein n=1 Tax=Conoideocrella luteorostrata TaxID=1105319 RepID=A0AAJ0CY88_9HYPO|nr:hypothetical protein QQS21_002949 [Conoideocrella luteorostrata]